MSAFKDLTGLEDGDLEVLRLARFEKGHALWVYWCRRCSREFEAKAYFIKTRKNKCCPSCTPSGNYKHGLRLTPEFKVWCSMIDRCHRPSDHSYRNYGGRGIYVCSRWRSSVRNFYHDVGPRPSAAHSIERLDVNGNYQPDNCCWATKKQQARNRRSTARLEYAGETLSLPEWADRSGIRLGTLRNRIYAGWPIEEAMTTPPGETRRRPNYWEVTSPNGELHLCNSLSAFAKAHDLNASGLMNVAYGRQNQHGGGWKCRRIARPASKQAAAS